MLLWVKTLEPPQSRGGGTYWCPSLVEDVVLEATLCFSIMMVLAIAMKLPRDDVYYGGLHVLVECNVCCCAVLGSRDSFGLPMMESLVCPGTDDNALADNAFLVFFGIVFLRSFVLPV
jgi:hypothetical protein